MTTRRTKITQAPKFGRTARINSLAQQQAALETAMRLNSDRGSLAQWETLKQENQTAAAQFYLENGVAIRRAQSAGPSKADADDAARRGMSARGPSDGFAEAARKNAIVAAAKKLSEHGLYTPPTPATTPRRKDINS